MAHNQEPDTHQEQEDAQGNYVLPRTGESSTFAKSIRLIAFLGAQAAILYITATLQLLGVHFFLSIWIVLEFLLGTGMIFWYHRGEREVGEVVSHHVGLMLVSETSRLAYQLEQLQYIQADILHFMDQTDSRITVIEEKLPKSRIRKLVHGTTSEHAAVKTDDLAASATGN